MNHDMTREDKTMTKIILFDTYTRRKREFIPLVPGNVGMYTCGPTVYDYPHIGNLRAYFFADILRRVLEYNGFTVKQVMNITDVGHLTSDADEGEDKIELRASQTRKSALEITKFFTEVFKSDLALLNIQPPQILSKATDHIKEQIALIKKLEELSYAYRISDGIYFDTSKFPRYGEMVKIKKQRLKPGARIDFNPEKRNPTDFALWKFSPPDKKRQMEWESPWGIGFPGWHIECSTMAMHYLGPTFDIHTGGIDHIPIHHTNEIAQSEAATGKQFVRYWLHSNFLRVEGQKMSKSLGNVFTLQDLISRGYEPLAFRYLLLTSHYRSETNFTWKALGGAQVTLNLLRSHIAKWPDGGEISTSLREKFKSRINDDLNTPRGIALLWDIVRSHVTPAEKKAMLLDFDRVLGLGLKEWGLEQVNKEVPPQVQALVLKREGLRREKKWTEADAVRREILTLGYYVEDTSEGSGLRKI